MDCLPFFYGSYRWCVGDSLVISFTVHFNLTSWCRPSFPSSYLNLTLNLSLVTPLIDATMHLPVPCPHVRSGTNEISINEEAEHI